MYYIHTGICYTYTFLLVRLERIIIILYCIILYYVQILSSQYLHYSIRAYILQCVRIIPIQENEKRQSLLSLKRYYIPTIESVYLPSFFLLTRVGNLFTRLLIPLISRTTLKEINTRKSTD